MKGLKTYFTYLHRNKLFTLVNVAGLGISLMFVLLIANMVVRQLTVGSDIKDIEHIYVLSNEEYSASNYLVGDCGRRMEPSLMSAYRPPTAYWRPYSFRNSAVRA